MSLLGRIQAVVPARASPVPDTTGRTWHWAAHQHQTGRETEKSHPASQLPGGEFSWEREQLL